MSPPLPPDWKCPRRVGFLFPHACRRTTPVDCPDCRNGQIEDPYGMRQDRYGYSRYDYYVDDYFFGFGPFGMTSGALDTAAMDFTEADGADLVTSGDEFENDVTES
ncbi:MAG: hypothetical protein LAQ69_21825 [Acidobacteriia bacterium]|nr:hypothetical protein [Terriglobia bacterium]